MREIDIDFPPYMERCCGFTVPEDGRFYIISFDDLALIDVKSGKIEVVSSGWVIRESECEIVLGEKRIPFLGLWGGDALLERNGIGKVQLDSSTVKLVEDSGCSREWEFENFSGDWEFVTFDRDRKAFLFGAPYSFDFKYIDFT